MQIIFDINQTEDDSAGESVDLAFPIDMNGELQEHFKNYKNIED
jgi:hypothetical protein